MWPACLLLLIPWVRDGPFPPALAGVGVAVLLVDLLTTGGIGIPAVAQSLWLLLALGLDGRLGPVSVSRAVVIVLLAIGLGLRLPATRLPTPACCPARVSCAWPGWRISMAMGNPPWRPVAAGR